MSFRKLLMSLALGCALPTAVAAQPAARVIDLRYEITFAGLTGFIVDITARIDGQSYDIESHTFKEGLIKAVTMHYIGRNRAWGSFGSEGAQPAGGSLSLAVGDKVRTWLAQYGFGGTLQEAHQPEWKPQPHHQISDEQRKGSLDPLSAAMFAVFAGGTACDRTIPTFDGKRRTDVTLTKVGTDSAANTGIATARGEAMICTIHTKRVAGEFFSKEDETESERQRPMRMWFVRLDDSQMYFPAKLEASTGFGTIRGQVTRFNERPLSEAERTSLRR
jgi:hypothetical protein